MCSSPKIPPMPTPEPPPPIPQAPRPPINPQRTTPTMAPSSMSSGMPTAAEDVYSRRGRGRSALTIPYEGAGSGGLNIPG